MPTAPGPAFVVGTGRCGSTLLFKLLAAHPKAYYFTGLLNRAPESQWLNKAFVKARHNRVIRPLTMSRLPPSEAWTFWERHVPGFSAPCRDLTGEDVTEVNRAAVARLLTKSPPKRHPHMVVKFTGWTRLGYIKEIFPAAPVLHLIRDPRAVVQSFLQVPWWDGWKGPSQWRWGDLTVEEDRLWRAHNRSFLVLAALNWSRVMRAYWTSKAILPRDHRLRIAELRYSDLCAKPGENMEFVRQHFGLPESRLFARRVAAFDIRSQDDKWRTAFTPAQFERLEAALDELGAENLMNGTIQEKNLADESFPRLLSHA